MGLFSKLFGLGKTYDITVGLRVIDKQGHQLKVNSINGNTISCSLEYGRFSFNKDVSELKPNSIQSLDIGLSLSMTQDQELEVKRIGKALDEVNALDFIVNLFTKTNDYLKKYSYSSETREQLKQVISNILDENYNPDKFYGRRIPSGLYFNQAICEYSSSEKLITFGMTKWGDIFLPWCISRIIFELKNELVKTEVKRLAQEIL